MQRCFNWFDHYCRRLEKYFRRCSIMETWVQNYTAIGGSLYLTAAAALLPIVFFFAALTVLKLKGYQAGLYTLLIALAVAVFGFGMPAGMAVSSLPQQPH
ncbi:lactate permease [Neisseria meningitidis]|nr:lactate permease [Neisseria meningitidis]